MNLASLPMEAFVAKVITIEFQITTSSCVLPVLFARQVKMVFNHLTDRNHRQSERILAALVL